MIFERISRSRAASAVSTAFHGHIDTTLNWHFLTDLKNRPLPVLAHETTNLSKKIKIKISTFEFFQKWCAVKSKTEIHFALRPISPSTARNGMCASSTGSISSWSQICECALSHFCSFYSYRQLE
jgi:hypothetical protein